MKKKKKWIIIAVVVLVIIMGAFSGGGDSSEPVDTADQAATTEATEAIQEKEPEKEKTFTMFSDDTVGATHHTLVGLENAEPSGKYIIEVTEGHGSININDEDLFYLAADEYEGKEQSGLTFEKSITVDIRGNDEITCRNFNSSNFAVTFYLVK